MYISSYRLRNQSISDTHIVHCGCILCDGSGTLMHETRGQQQPGGECPACEGLGYLVEPELPSHAQIITVEEAHVLPLSNDYTNPTEPLKQAA